MSTDAAQRESISQTFLGEISTCGNVNADLKSVKVSYFEVNSVITNTGRLPITVVALYSGSTHGDKALKFAGVYLEHEDAAPFVNQPFTLNVGEGVALSAVYDEHATLTPTDSDFKNNFSTITTVALSSGERVLAQATKADVTPIQIAHAYSSANKYYRSLCPSSKSSG